MVVSECPICHKQLVGFQWAKTKNQKNWLKKGDEWHDCPNKKFTKKTAGKHKRLDFSQSRSSRWDFGIIPSKWDSDEGGYYCQQGHFQAGLFSAIPNHCAVCGWGTAVVILEREKHI